MTNKSYLRLIRFEFYCGRQGSLNGTFMLDEEGWDKLQNLIEAGDVVYFGEVLGKHSEVFGPIDPDDIEVVTEDQDWLHKAQELGIDLDSGYNPLDYYEEDDDED